MLYEALLNTEPSEGEQEGMEMMTTIPKDKISNLL